MSDYLACSETPQAAAPSWVDLTPHRAGRRSGRCLPPTPRLGSRGAPSSASRVVWRTRCAVLARCDPRQLRPFPTSRSPSPHAFPAPTASIDHKPLRRRRQLNPTNAHLLDIPLFDRLPQELVLFVEDRDTLMSRPKSQVLHRAAHVLQAKSVGHILDDLQVHG